MSKNKQQKEAEIPQEEQFLFAIGTPEGEIIVKVDTDGNIIQFKDNVTLTEASTAFWNSFQQILPITQDDIEAYPNDTELGAYVRNRMINKLNK